MTVLVQVILVCKSLVREGLVCNGLVRYVPDREILVRE